MQRISDAFAQVSTARRFTQDMLSHIDAELWFRQPTEGVTHVAWQVGHLAVAQYGLALKRVRGEQPTDEQLIPAGFRKAFGKGSVPQADPANCPSIDEIRSVLDGVHECVLTELPSLPESLFDELSDVPPHPMFETKLGAILWAAKHEFIHIGQIALLRRLLGNEWLR
ncbi:MAG: hypothetical protein CMJ64_25185 [Planctomycetaceae bacterium]|nr:hypothetical protein [Planctomycetaceae bacterium]